MDQVFQQFFEYTLKQTLLQKSYLLDYISNLCCGSILVIVLPHFITILSNFSLRQISKFFIYNSNQTFKNYLLDHENSLARTKWTGARMRAGKVRPGQLLSGKLPKNTLFFCQLSLLTISARVPVYCIPINYQ